MTGRRVPRARQPPPSARPPALTGSGAAASRHRSARPGSAATSREIRPRAAEEAVAAPASRETRGAGRARDAVARERLSEGPRRGAKNLLSVNENPTEKHRGE